MSPTTKEEKSSRFRSRPNTSIKITWVRTGPRGEDTEANREWRKAFKRPRRRALGWRWDTKAAKPVGGSVDYAGYRAEQEEVLSPVRLGKKQDDGEAFLGGVLWCLVLACGVGSGDGR